MDPARGVGGLNERAGAADDRAGRRQDARDGEEHVGFNALIEKVHQAEVALEAKERQTAANWRQARGSFRAFWTPGRLVLAGLASGFLVGKAEPFKKAAAGGTLQLISALGSLFAGGSAQAAAVEAEQAADAAEGAERMREPGRPARPAPAHAAPAQAQAQATVERTAPPPRAAPAEGTARVRPHEHPDTFRGSGQL